MPGTFDEVSCVSPTPTTSSGDGITDPRDFKDFGGIRSWREARSSSALDRRSESSDSLDNHSTSSGTGRHLQDFGSTEYIPTRTSKTAPKVAYNPMQFVKTGPAKLFISAQEQLKKAEEIKKVREKKKDEIEDWQTNLEGWKSSRRKKQEDVIERVTEVKRMEQEEANKASEAAAKRLMGIREKRGKLMALYSTEDNDAIEFGSIPTSPSSPPPAQPTEDKSNKTRENGDSNHKSSAYDKAIEDYVKYTNSALGGSKTSDNATTNGQPNDRTSEPHQHHINSENRDEHGPSKPRESSPLDQSQPQVPKAQSPTGSATNSSTEAVKRRSIPFEKPQQSGDDCTTRSLQRRSGEFSSTFKNRLSTFEMTESTTDERKSSERTVTPERVDPTGFKNKLAAFQAVETSKNASERRNSVPVNSAPESNEEQLNFKAKLAAFRQAEVTKPPPPPPPAAARRLSVETKNADKPNTEPAPTIETPATKPVKPALPTRNPLLIRTTEPIYANSSVQKSETSDPVAEPIASPRSRSIPSTPAPPLLDPALDLSQSRSTNEESDCTEDEGIRSLSPHETQSPTSPTHSHSHQSSDPASISTSYFQSEVESPMKNRELPPIPPPCYPPEEDDRATPNHPSDSRETNPIPQTFYPQVNSSRHSKDREIGSIPPPSQPEIEIAPSPTIADMPDHSTRSTKPTSPVPTYQPVTSSPPIQEVWDASDWLVVGSSSRLSTLAPPSEKPPPPPVSDPPDDSIDDILQESPAQKQVSPVNWNPPTSSTNRMKELKKRRSDFLGLDPSSVTQEVDEELFITPPPDLKSLLRNVAGDFRAPAVDSRARSEADVDTIDSGSRRARSDPVAEEELARKEREIIESLEKEEEERLRSSSGVYLPDAEDSKEMERRRLASTGTSEYEMNAEIEQLAREWHADAMGLPSASWRGGSTVPSNPSASISPSISVSPPAPADPVRAHPPPFPAKPSRLSAAPKSKLHDGEAWMARRKVAVEGQTSNSRPNNRDVSRHWLIQEAEQRRIDAMQERRAAPSAAPSAASVEDNWLPRSSSSNSMDRLSLKDHQTRSTSSLGSSPTSLSLTRPLYANQEEILEYADFTGPPQMGPQVWQVRSISNSGSMDQLQSIATGPASQSSGRPLKNQQSKSVTHLAALQVSSTQTQPTWRSTAHPPLETEKEPIAPLPHSVIHTLTQRMSQRNSNSSLASSVPPNYGDYMNIQEVANMQQQTQQQQQSRAGPQVPAQRPANYRHPNLAPSLSAPQTSSSSLNSNKPNNNTAVNNTLNNSGDRMLSVSGKKKCSLCQEELGRGAAMIIESLRLFYHIGCFRCCVCGIALGNGTAGTDVRVRNNHLHCHDCYSNDDGLKFSKV